MKKRIGIIGNPASLPTHSRDNTGNIIHGHAALHLFADADYIDFDLSESNIEKVRSEFTHVGFVAATNLHVSGIPSYIDSQVQAATLIEKLDLPVCAFGFGCHAQLGDTISAASVDSRSIKLLRVLAERSHTIGVRGAFTADLCAKYGVTNVSIVGCQSAYVAAMINCSKRNLTTSADRPCVNFSWGVKEGYMMYLALTEGAQVIGQGNPTETAIRNGEISRKDFLAKGANYQLMPIVETAIRIGIVSRDGYYDYVFKNFHKFYDVDLWRAHIAQHYDFCVGTRFHGNMAALQAGIPALWIEHDMRVRELCEHLGLPSLPVSKLTRFNSLRAFSKICSYEKFWTKMPERSREFLDYLAGNGVKDLLAPDISSGLVHLSEE